MSNIIIFGGTTEGRELCEFCSALAIPVLYCVATSDGEQAVAHLPGIKTHVARLKAGEMLQLILQNPSLLVVDATHPYAQTASKNISDACEKTTRSLLRIDRKSLSEDSCLVFSNTRDLLDWIGHEEGNIFVTTGVSGAAIFASLPDFQSRVWLRILPNIDSLQSCLALGYPPKHIICMQGPFSEDMNFAMFKEAKAKILITKNSGHAGGFSEKLSAATRLSMITAVLAKPDHSEGISLEEAFHRIKELRA